ncbi:hypothetical protein PVK06_002426 [Gossypium arboreum]|uniref:Uncharacterized protein n=1 Tax=Gossypium arboreum TaxID=29729 RepID=A0ABR0R4R6_GOSAR|nr:hypothetical protein PVK06_002426 [Gossypium arboreum]
MPQSQPQALLCPVTQVQHLTAPRVDSVPTNSFPVNDDLPSSVQQRLAQFGLATDWTIDLVSHTGPVHKKYHD